MRRTVCGLFALGLISLGCAPEEEDGREGWPNYDAGPAPIVSADAGQPGADAAFVPPAPVEAGVSMGSNDAKAPVPSAEASVIAPASDGGASDASSAPSDSGSSVSVSGPEPTIPKPSMACPSFMSGSMTINGLKVEVQAGPKSSGAKGPLLFYWHGTGGTGAEPFGSAARPGSLPDSVKKEIMDMGGLIIAPTDTTARGTDVTLVLGVWFTPGDLEWADFVAGCAVQDYNIDPRRIYATGCSAGGLMTGSMAFQRSRYLAAAAPNSGGIAVPGQDAPQDPKRVAPTMTMHGKAGTDVVIVDFSETSATLASSSKAKGGFVVNCDHGQGHCRTPPELQVAAWQFMKDHPFGVSPEPYANGLPASFPKYCVIK